MNVNHPDGNKIIVMQEGIGHVGEIEINGNDSGWVTIGYIGAKGLLIDQYEWKAFVALVTEIDKVITDTKLNVLTDTESHV